MHNYKELDLKIGLEIHQQLDGTKLFCSCPCLIKDSLPDFTLQRSLRASASELGVIDKAALHELKKGKYFLYQGYYDATCLVELDESPPEKVNKETLEMALQATLLFHATPVDFVQFMRKIVIDGSNVSGFQRTALIAVNGWIETSEGKISIPTICLEEESAKKGEDTENYSTYNLSRLGIPLLEVVTGPDIKSAEGAKEAAEKIGMVLRSLKGVKRGLGTIRQDVNLSIKGHPRVEIKGFQDLKSIPKVADYEITRQLALLKIHEQLKNYKPRKEEILDLSSCFKNTNCELIKKVLLKNGKVFGAKLEGYSGLLGIQFSDTKRFGTELSNYAKTYGVGGIIHSDEDLQKYHFSEKEIFELRQILQVHKEDAFLLVAAEVEKAKHALIAAVKRANLQYTADFPSEVRKAETDFTTSFLRPMPGAERMYPETDIPLIPITQELLKNIVLPALLDEQIADLEELYNLQPEIARALLKKQVNFASFVQLYTELEPAFIARVLVELPKEIKARFNLDSSLLTAQHLHEVLGLLNQKKINKEATLELLADLLKLGKIDLMKYTSVSDKDLEEEIKKIIEGNKNASFNALMGEIMSKFRGKIDGKKAAELIKKYLK